MESETFAQWLHQGGVYVVWLGGVITAICLIVGIIVKAVAMIRKPAQEAAKKSEEGDAALHERIDHLEENEKECSKKFANDFQELKGIRRDLNTQAESIAMLTDGVFLVIQHLVTDDHVDDMEEWMRNHAKNAITRSTKNGE